MEDPQLDSGAQSHGQFFGHPKALWFLLLTEMWERFSFYGMSALLVLYLRKHFLFTENIAYGIYGSYMALATATPVLGGWLADRFLGQRKAVVMGAILMVLGHFGMAFEGEQATSVSGNIVRDKNALQVFYFSLACLILGVGFLKPNITTIIGKLYEKHDPKRESGFTIFQMGIMSGGFLAALFCGYLGENYGWKYGFGIAGVGMLFGLVFFLWGQRFLLKRAEPPDIHKLNQPYIARLSRMHIIHLGTIVAVLIAWKLVQYSEVVGVLLLLFTICIVISMFYIALYRCSTLERDRLFSLMSLMVLMIAFAVLIEQHGSSMISFADRNVNRQLDSIGSEGEVKASQFKAVLPLTMMLFAPLFAWLWPVLAKRNMNPSSPAKFGWAILFVSLGFFMLAYGISQTDSSNQVSMFWLIGTYALFGVSDIFYAAVCYSSVTSLSPSSLTGFMMGGMMLTVSIGHYISAGIARFFAVPQDADPGISLSIYSSLYTTLALASVFVLSIVIVVTPFIRRRMHGIN